MGSKAGAGTAPFRGVHAVDWGLPPDVPVTPGLRWHYRGRALRLDRSGTAPLPGRTGPPSDRRARTRAARLPSLHLAHLPGELVLTDGRHLFPARLVEAGGRRTIVFDPWLPPADADLWVAACAAPALAGRPDGLTCGIVAGTPVATESGPRPVETLRPGDRVLTRDNGPQPVLWRGQTRLSGAELILHPHLRPVVLAPGALGRNRPHGALRLAPGHRLLVPGLPGLDDHPEALATAADLENGRTIRRDLTTASVSYVHLLLPRHEIVLAAGLDCASFHPALADPCALRWHARGLDQAVPGLSAAPHRLGDPARRCLTRAEAALLAYSA